MSELFGLRKIVIKIDGEQFDSFEKIKLNPKHKHHQQIHYSRTTKCRLGITKRLKTERNMVDVTCPDCLQLHITKIGAQLKFFENILEEVRS